MIPACYRFNVHFLVPLNTCHEITLTFFVVTEKTMERDTFFTPIEAKKFGLVDEVQQNATSKLRTHTTNS